LAIDGAECQPSQPAGTQHFSERWQGVNVGLSRRFDALFAVFHAIFAARN
jgi:hypothetical protein